MRYARIIDNVAVDVIDVPPLRLYTSDIASQFVVVPDIVQGSVRLSGIDSNGALTSEPTWQAPRTFIEEYEAGKFRYAQADATPEPVYTDPPPPKAHITQLAFLNRFTDAEAIAIDLASIGATVPAASIRRYLNKANAARYIDLSLAETRAGVHSLETFGLIGAGRAAVILDTPIQPHEISPE